MINITRRDFINYAVLPGLRPRLHDLFATGFQYIPFFMALVYGSVKLLPSNHPYLNASNIGRFGIRHVIAEAANNLHPSLENIDQIILFVTILIGLILVIAQIFLLGMIFFFQPVMAAMPINFAGFFVTANPEQDIAHMLLDMVFGVPDFFNSCVNNNIMCLDEMGDPIEIAGLAGTSIYAPLGFPFPVHKALHQMFLIYSEGLLVVAAFITIYFMIAIVVETAQTGTAFGKRFNKVWAPIRIVVAFGLLVPLPASVANLNASQYIVLYAAKFGSAFATNGWILFNTTLTNTYLGQKADLVSQPNVPEVGALLQFYYVARTCQEFEQVKNHKDIDPYLVSGPFNPSGTSFFKVTKATTYEQMLKFVEGNDQVIIRFGYNSEVSFPHYLGNVKPICGEVVMPLTDPRCPNHGVCGRPSVATTEIPDKGTEVMQRYYWFILKELWFDSITETPDPSIASLTPYTGINFPRNTVMKETQIGPHLPMPKSTTLPEEDYKQALQEFYSDDLESAMLNPGATGIAGIIGSGIGALKEQANSARYDMDPVLQRKGWGGAGIWYNRVAELNGAVSSAVLNIPLPSKYPDVMEYVHFKKRQQDSNVPFASRFQPTLANGDYIIPPRPEDPQAIAALSTAFNFWQADGHTTSSHSGPTGNAVIDIINALFGTEGLFNMRDNPNVHPLAKLVGVGRVLIESAVRNLTYAVIGGASGAGLSVFDELSGPLLQIASSYLVTFAMIGLTAGFILFYIVPFLPFIYFFFAVGRWVKGIFEAMVGAPLWALAHIRIDGNGLSGQAAINGYFLIFEIFLRPILIIFGLLASISIFSALVDVMNQTWDLVVSNVGGFDVKDEIAGTSGISKLPYWRSAIDEFFFTVIYTLVVYLMGMSSFKLIDHIPNNILRWMGQNVASFGDQSDDPAQNLVSSASVGSQQALSSLGGGLQKMTRFGKGG